MSQDELSSGLDRERAGYSPWLWRIAALLVVGMVAVIAGPDLLSSPDASRPMPHRSPGPSVLGASAGGSTAPSGPALRWKPRGPDVGSDFAAAAMARMHELHQDVHQLLWAGSLDGQDHVAVAAFRPHPESIGDVEVAALRVRRVSDVANAESQTIGFLTSDGALLGAAWRGADAHTRLLLLSNSAVAPEVQVSTTVDYHPDGGISRRWRGAAVTDGVGVVDLGRPVDPVIVVRQLHPGGESSAFLVAVNDQAATPTDVDVEVAGVASPSYAGPAPDVLVASLAESVRTLFDLRDSDARVLWSGQLAGGRDTAGDRVTGRAALVLLRRHDGPMFQAFVYADPSGQLRSVTANPVPWSVADTLPVAFSTYQKDAPLFLISPRVRGTVTVTARIGPPLRLQVGSDRVATVAEDAVAGPNLSGAPIVVRGHTGRTVLRSTLVDPGTVDPFGLYL